MRNKLFWPVALAAILSITSCLKAETFVAEISDLNGTWQPDWSYKAALDIPENERHYSQWEYAWGTGKRIINATFDIDLVAQEPYISESDLGSFYNTEITKAGKNAITVQAYRAPPDDPDDRENGWKVEVTFHFIDRDTLWIETKDFTGNEYGKRSPWHRLSGPAPAPR
jgi:hypothetical protein